MANLTNTLIGNIEPQKTERDYTDSKVTGLKVRVPKISAGGDVSSPVNKTFYLYYTIAGSRKKYRIGKFGDIGLPEARKVAEKLLAEIALGNDPQGNKVAQRVEAKKLKSGTLRIFLDEQYYPYAELHQKAHRPAKRLIERNWSDWMNKPLSDITPKLVDQWRNKEIRKGIQPQTINHATAILKGVISKAFKWDVISINQLAGYSTLKVDKGGVVRWLSPEEEKNLYLTIYKRTDQIRTIIILMLNTGARKMEVLSLRWSNIDLENRTLTYKADDTKTAQTRKIPLNDRAIRELERWKLLSKSEFLFPSNSESGHVRNMSQTWYGVRDKVGLKNFRLYDLRHSFASKLVMHGIDLYTVSKLLGHSDISMTQVYAHLSHDHLTQAVAVL